MVRTAHPTLTPNFTGALYASNDRQLRLVYLQRRTIFG